MPPETSTLHLCGQMIRDDRCDRIAAFHSGRNRRRISWHTSGVGRRFQRVDGRLQAARETTYRSRLACKAYLALNLGEGLG